MSNTPVTTIDERENRGPSRAEIETLYILHAVGEQGCRADDLAARLGLSSKLAAAVVAGVEPLFRSGWLMVEDDLLRVTTAGHEHLHRRLEALGVA